MKEKILRATAKLISERGIEAVSIRGICGELNITAPTLYHYFKDKKALIEGVTTLAYQKYQAKIDRDIKNKTPIEALIKIWDIYFDFVSTESELYLTIVLAHANGNIPRIGYESFESAVEIFQRAYEDGLIKYKPFLAAQIYYSAAQGAALMYISQNRNRYLLNGIRELRTICLNGIFLTSSEH